MAAKKIDLHQFNTLMRQAEERMVLLTQQKGEEYTRGSADRLANFRRIGKQLEGMTLTAENAPMVVWLVYFHKHLDALVNYVKTGKVCSSESMEGRVDDMQVYLNLFRGFIWENNLREATDESSKPAT